MGVPGYREYSRVSERVFVSLLCAARCPEPILPNEEVGGHETGTRSGW
jgi:hypothetical protein